MAYEYPAGTLGETIDPNPDTAEPTAPEMADEAVLTTLPNPDVKLLIHERAPAAPESDLVNIPVGSVALVGELPT